MLLSPGGRRQPKEIWCTNPERSAIPLQSLAQLNCPVSHTESGRRGLDISIRTGQCDVHSEIANHRLQLVETET